MKSHKQNREILIEENLIENYNRYYRLAYHYVKNESDAMDIVQEAAYKAILKSDTLKNPEYIGTWICRIVINEAYNVLRKNQKEQNRSETEKAEAPCSNCGKRNRPLFICVIMKIGN